MFGFFRSKESKPAPAAEPATAAKVHRVVSAPYPTVAGGVAVGKPARALTGLSGDDLDQIYQRGETRVVAAGERLFAADDSPDTLCFLVKGEAALLDGGGTQFEHLAPGTWLRPADFGANSSIQCSATAQTDCTITLLSAATVSNLNEPVQLRLLHQLETGHREKLQHHATRLHRLARQNRLLAEALYLSRERGRSEFAQSDVVSQVIERVPRLPVATASLLAKLYDEKTTQAEVVDLVKSDPGLTAMLLKAINSPFYGLQHKIANVGHAVTLLGFDTVHQLVLSESMRKSLPETSQFLKIYHRAVERAQIALSLGVITGYPHPAEISTAALLADIGRVVLELLKQQNPRLADLLIPVDPAILGARLLRNWNLPEELCLTVEFAQHPEYAPPSKLPSQIVAPVALLHLTDLALDRLRGESHTAELPFTEAYLQALGLRQTLDSLVRERLLPHLRQRIAQLPRSLAAVLSG